MVQCNNISSTDALVVEQARTLKQELFNLDGVFEAGRRAMLFHSWDSIWNANTIEDVGVKTY